jgi:hypothetical protein
MRAFLACGPTLAFLLVAVVTYPREEGFDARRAWIRGLVFSVPTVLIARLLGLLLPHHYVSIFLVLHEWIDRILPYALLPALGYAVFYHFKEKLQPGAAERRMTAFYSGALSPVGFVEALRFSGEPVPYMVFLLPTILVSILLLAPALAFSMYRSYGFRLVILILGGLAFTVAASLGVWLYFLKLWPLAWILAAGLCLGSWILAAPRLRARSIMVLPE